jgi:3-carboxy-cis,cis-muconate cycloisomerase
MMALGRHLGRETAHDLVYDLCREAIRTRRPLVDLLSEHAEIRRHASREDLERWCDPARYLGQAGAMVDRVLARLAA